MASISIAINATSTVWAIQGSATGNPPTTIPAIITCPQILTPAGIASVVSPAPLSILTSTTVPQAQLATGTPVILSAPCTYTLIPSNNGQVIVPSSTGAVTGGNWSTTANPSPTGNVTVPATENSGVSAGAAAGIGIGLCVAGLIAGLAAAACFFRRRRPPATYANARSASIPAATTGILAESKSPAAVVTSIDPFLLEGAGDSEITPELTALGYLIEQHVDNHYHTNSVQQVPPSFGQTLVSEFGFDEATRARLVTLCTGPTTRRIALRHILSRVIFSSLDVHRVAVPGMKHSLLPAEITAFIRAVPSAKVNETGPNSTNATALTTWRRISALLLQTSTSGQDRAPLRPSPSMKTQVEALCSALNPFLAPFAGRQGGLLQQVRHLETVIYECAKFGYELFSHPCDWQYIFVADKNEIAREQTKGQDLIVVVPGLKKLSNVKGQLYNVPIVVVKPVTAGVPGIEAVL